MITLCTRNYLYFARALVSSFRKHHLRIPAFILIVDWDRSEPLVVEGATLLSGPELGIAHFDYMALKYSATDMCCAIKPYALDYLFRNTRFQKIIYIDADIYIFAPLDALIERLDRYDFVVTPHVLAPTPHPERFSEHPTLGDLAFAGPFNAGLFGVRATSQANAFIDIWRDLVTQPGAFMTDLGGQMEQNSFNWVTCFTDSVAVLRDAAYNAAYWNLHDRSLRYEGLDEPGRESWTVDGRPLVAYHFSGFSPDKPYALSKYDSRYSLYILPSLARLFDFYAARLFEHGAEEDLRRKYHFDSFPSGIKIDERMRRVFKEHETFLWSELSPWSPEGEAYYCEALLSPVPYTASLLPILFEVLYAGRPDLQQLYPDARLVPEPMLKWISSHGIFENKYEELFDRYRTVLPSQHGAVSLTKARKELPRIFADLANPMSADRHVLIERLQDAGLTALAASVQSGDFEHYYVSPIQMIRRILDERPDVKSAFPDPLYADAPAFARWLGTHATEDHFLPAHAPDIFIAKAEGRSLARIFSFLSRTWHIMPHFPLGLVGEGARELARILLAVVRDGLEFDLDDVLMYLWTMDVKPWAGLALTLELPVNACRVPSPLLEEGQDQLLGPLLARDPRFREALLRYRQEYSDERSKRQMEAARRFHRAQGCREVLVLQALHSSNLPPRAGGGGAHQARFAIRGLNLFGFHKSPIGLGNLTRGLHMALADAGIPVQPNLLTNCAMDADLSPRDFLRTYGPDLDTNVFVSYPHLHEMLLNTFPEHVTRGRRNIIYLAWEQRDGAHYWPEVYKDFDQVWALSDFAAECFRRFMQRDVVTVPCVLDFSKLPSTATKSDLALDPGKFTFIYIFDANSSIERKNPEGVIQAFSQAFSPDDNVCLLLRVSNAQRLHHKERIRRILAAAPPSLDIRLILGEMCHADLLRLLSAVDCYVSLHRAEGFGYTCAEAMAYGKPVIATGYSGNLQFMSRDNSFLVEYRETGVEVGDGPFQRGSVWAEPDIRHAAHLMRAVWRDPGAAQAVGQRAREDVRTMLSAASVGKIAAQALGWQPPAESGDSADQPPLSLARAAAL